MQACALEFVRWLIHNSREVRSIIPSNLNRDGWASKCLRALSSTALEYNFVELLKSGCPLASSFQGILQYTSLILPCFPHWNDPAGASGMPLARLELQNGEVLKAKLVIGADGAQSQVRTDPFILTQIGICLNLGSNSLSSGIAKLSAPNQAKDCILNYR